MKKYLLITIIFIIDLILKQIVWRIPHDFFLIPNFFAFKLFQNPALGFSLYFPANLIIILSVIILLGLAIVIHKRPALLFPAFLIWLGALSNLLDRWRYGFVIDYFHLYPISYFNLADLLIFVGAVFLIFKLSKK